MCQNSVQAALPSSSPDLFRSTFTYNYLPNSPKRQKSAKKSDCPLSRRRRQRLENTRKHPKKWPIRIWEIKNLRLILTLIFWRPPSFFWLSFSKIFWRIYQPPQKSMEGSAPASLMSGQLPFYFDIRDSVRQQVSDGSVQGFSNYLWPRFGDSIF